MESIKKLRTVRDFPFNDGVIKTLPKKGSPKYVSGHVILDILNNVFGDNYSIEYDSPRTEMLNNQVVTSVKCRITANFRDEEGNPVTVVREGFGSDILKQGKSDTPGSGNEGNTLKSASTDALKKAAYSFGIINQFLRDPSEYNYYQSLVSDKQEWTQEAYNAYAKEWNIITAICKKLNINQMILSSIVYKETNGQDKNIRPSNITNIVKVLQQMINSLSPQAQEENKELTATL